MDEIDRTTPLSDTEALIVREIREAPRRSCASRSVLAQPLRRARRAAAAAPAAGRRHLRARQLGACRHLRQAPDRAVPRHSGRAGRAEHRQRLSTGACTSQGQLFLAISQSGRSDDLIELTRSRQGRRRAHRRPSSSDRTARWRRPATSSCRWAPGPSSASPRPRRSSPRPLRWRGSTAAWAGDDGAAGGARAAAGAAWPRRPSSTGAPRCGAWRRRQPGHHRPRADARDRARGGAEAQGNLQPARRGVQRRGIPARSGGAGVAALSDPDVHADRCGRRGHAAAGGGPAREGRGAVHRRARRSVARDGCRRSHPIIRRPTPSA